jgi:hypothetical protein
MVGFRKHTRPAADPARAIIFCHGYSGDWEEFHDFRRIQRHRQLYGTPMNTHWLNQAERLEIN